MAWEGFLGRERMSGRVPVVLLTAALVLMVSGSLRDLVSPVGYWAAWGVWAVATLIATRRAGAARAAAGPPGWVMGSYAVLCLGMLLSAAVSQNGTSAYQALKIAVIAGLFVAMWRLALWSDWRQLVLAMSWAIGLMLVSLAVSKIWDPTGQALAGDAREGSFLAVYGVLWKAGAFFLPVFLADAVETPGAWARNGLMIAACVFLVLIDGSRTGLLLVGATAVGFVAFLVWRGDGRLVRGRWLWTAVALLLVLQILDTGANMAVNRPPAVRVSASGAPIGAVAAAEPARVFEGALAHTFSTRLGRGDPARIELLRASLGEVAACLPLGCGFGAMGTDIGTGSWMVVHNAYLAALGDFGVLGLAGMLGFLVAAWLPVRKILRTGRQAEHACFIVAAAGSALAYGMALMLNTFTTEMSEWGYLILMLAFAWAPPARA
jgi:O-antigen ligase